MPMIFAIFFMIGSLNVKECSYLVQFSGRQKLSSRFLCNQYTDFFFFLGFKKWELDMY